jgi:hypothetical protein
MHAHNELTILNRLLMFAAHNTGDDEVHNPAPIDSQMSTLCIVHVLSCSPAQGEFLRAPGFRERF